MDAILFFIFSRTYLLIYCYFCFQVMNGPTYNISIVGSGVTPALDFSFTSHDFGACFIHRAGLPIPKKVLTITNNDTKDVRYDHVLLL